MEINVSKRVPGSDRLSSLHFAFVSKRVPVPGSDRLSSLHFAFARIHRTFCHWPSERFTALEIMEALLNPSVLYYCDLIVQEFQ